jgi:hypothetical protein
VLSPECGSSDRAGPAEAEENIKMGVDRQWSMLYLDSVLAHNAMFQPVAHKRCQRLSGVVVASCQAVQCWHSSKGMIAAKQAASQGSRKRPEKA